MIKNSSLFPFICPAFALACLLCSSEESKNFSYRHSITRFMDIFLIYLSSNGFKSRSKLEGFLEEKEREKLTSSKDGKKTVNSECFWCWMWVREESGHQSREFSNSCSTGAFIKLSRCWNQRTRSHPRPLPSLLRQIEKCIKTCKIHFKELFCVDHRKIVDSWFVIQFGL